MHDRERKKAIRTGPYWHPLVGDRGVAGANRIDRHKLGAVAFQFFKADLDGIGRMIFGDTPEDKVFRTIPIGRAEFPERKSDRVKTRRRHVNRAKSTVRSPVRRAKLLRPQSGKRLHLITASKERKLLRIGRTNVLQARGQRVQRLVPRNRHELARAALRAGLSFHRPGQFGF